VHLTRLALTDFRSYAGAELSLEPGVSTLLGPNGQGKTNLVEAAAYVAADPTVAQATVDARAGQEANTRSQTRAPALPSSRGQKRAVKRW